MINYPVLWNLLLLMLEVWVLLGLIILLHRFSHRIGLSPLIVVLGGLTGGLQLMSLGSLTIQLGDQNIFISVGSYVILPGILSGLLLIYIAQGTIRMRSSFWGVIFLSLLIIVYRLGVQYLPASLSVQFQDIDLNTISLRSIFASVGTLIVDMLVLTIVYQAVSNALKRHPSWLAGLAAITAALWVDALLFPILALAGDPGWQNHMLVHLAGKTLSGFIVWPVLGPYIARATPFLPESAATTPRAALDIFQRNVEVEARARFHHSLLLTISKIHQLILTSDSIDTLLQETCEILVRRREYDSITIAIPGKRAGVLEPRYSASNQKIPLPQSFFEDREAPPLRAWYSGESQVTNLQANTHQHASRSAENHHIRCNLMISLPVTHGKHTYGVIVLCNTRVDPLPELEIEWLEIIAGDLAYAISNLHEHQSRILLQSAVETLHDGLLITDLDGTIQYANKAIEQLTGFQRSELIGESPRKMYATDFPRDVFTEWERTLTETGSLQIEQEFSHSDGKKVYTALNASLVRINEIEPKYFAASFHDITSLRSYENQLLTLHELTNELVQIHDPDMLYRTILESSERLLQADASVIYFLGDDGHTIVQALNHNLDPAYAQRIASDYSGLPGETASRTMRPVTVNDTLKSSEYGERIHFMADFGIRALMILPIRYQKKRIGALTVYYQNPQTFTDHQRQVGLILAQTLAIIVENTRLYQAEFEQRRFSEALAQAAFVLNSTVRAASTSVRDGSLEPPKVLDLILEQTMRVIPCRAVNIMFLDGDRLLLAGHRGYGEDHKIIQELIQQVDWRLTPSLIKMKETGKPIIISDTASEDGWVQLPSTQWIRSYAAAPLIVGCDTVGFLNVDSDRPGQFTEATVPQLSAFADHVSVAVQNARLYQELQDYADMLKASVDARTNELLEAQQALEGILSSVSDAVFLLDTGNQIIQANQAADQLRQQAEEISLQLFSGSNLDKLQTNNTSSEDRIIDIGSRTYQAVSSQLKDDQDQVVGQIVIFRDVTRFRELDQLKSKFVSDVSHELRTPLTNMTLYLELLKVDEEKNNHARYMETLQRETDRLTDLIEDLLTISRLEAGRVEVTLQQVDPNVLLADLVNDRAILASQKRIRLIFKQERKLPRVTADSRLLTQALSNLITNAIHYTPERGKILVRTLTQLHESKQFVTICVKDNGYGISTSEMPLIFDRFYRGDASRKTEAPGTGLGLSIAKEIISQFNGFIEISSTEGKGSTFTIWLPALTD